MKLLAFTKNGLLIAGIILFHSNVFAQAMAVKSQWVYMNAANKLDYKTTERGDQIMDDVQRRPSFRLDCWFS